MSLKATSDGTIAYQCSLCMAPDIGRLWLYTTTRGYICPFHGRTVYYEFSSGITYEDQEILRGEPGGFSTMFIPDISHIR